MEQGGVQIIGLTEYFDGFVDVLGRITTAITGSPVLMTMFCGSVLIIGAKVFKRIKNASK